MKSWNFLKSLVVCGLLIGGSANAHNYDPNSFDPTGTTQRTIEYDPLSPNFAGTVTTISEGTQPLVGEYECSGESGFVVDFSVESPVHTELEGCGLAVPYVFINKGTNCEVSETGLEFMVEVETMTACFPASCFELDEDTGALFPQEGCQFTAFWTSVLKEVEAELEVITNVVETLTYTEVTWDATRNLLRAELSSRLSGEVKNIALGFPEVETNLRANIDIPAPGSHVSGIGQITGWSCPNLPLEGEICDANGHIRDRFPLLHGSSRADTEPVCGDILNGFSTHLNWSRFQSGEYTIHLIQDGTVVMTRSFFTTELDQEFVMDVAGECVLDDFPYPGGSVVLEWQESQQNFAITEYTTQ